MQKLRTWLLERFLPAWAKDTVYRENEALRDELESQRQEVQRLNAYIDGLEIALRSSRQRIIIQGGVKP